jgi:holin-like protein
VISLVVFGDMIADRLEAPVPGAAIGMVLLATAFAIQGGPDDGLGRLFDTVSPHFTMFFVPAAVGVVASVDILANAWPHFVAAIVLGTTLTIAFTGLLTQALLRLLRRERTT